MIESENKIPEIVGGNNEFAMDYLSSYSVTEEIVNNAIVSSFSVVNALMMAALAAKGATKDQILNTLQMQNLGNSFHSSFDTLILSLEHQNEVIVICFFVVYFFYASFYFCLSIKL